MKTHTYFFILFLVTFSLSVFAQEKSTEATSIDWTSVLEKAKSDTAYQQYQAEQEVLFNQLVVLDNILKEINEKGELNFAKYKEIELQQLQVVDTLENLIVGFVKLNAQKPIGEYVFWFDTYLIKNDKVRPLLALLSPQFRATKEAQRIEKALIMSDPTAVGKPYVDITGFDVDGRKIKLSEYVGVKKVVLLDFWASWCRPCRADMPKVKNLYEKYHHKGFEVIGVSLDDNKEAWLKASKDENVLWPQLSNLKGYDDEAVKAYGINYLPAKILIDQNGIIVGRVFSEYGLNFKIQELLEQ